MSKPSTRCWKPCIYTLSQVSYTSNTVLEALYLHVVSGIIHIEYGAGSLVSTRCLRYHTHRIRCWKPCIYTLSQVPYTSNSVLEALYLHVVSSLSDIEHIVDRPVSTRCLKYHTHRIRCWKPCIYTLSQVSVTLNTVLEVLYLQVVSRIIHIKYGAGSLVSTRCLKYHTHRIRCWKPCIYTLSHVSVTSNTLLIALYLHVVSRISDIEYIVGIPISTRCLTYQ